MSARQVITCKVETKGEAESSRASEWQSNNNSPLWARDSRLPPFFIGQSWLPRRFLLDFPAFSGLFSLEMVKGGVVKTRPSSKGEVESSCLHSRRPTWLLLCSETLCLPLFYLPKVFCPAVFSLNFHPFSAIFFGKGSGWSGFFKGEAGRSCLLSSETPCLPLFIC